MKKLLYFVLPFLVLFVRGQVGINTESPETTLDVLGKPEDINHFDGIIPPRITGDQLTRKSYSASKKGAVVYVTVPSTVISGQVINVIEPGPYFFDGSIWQPLSRLQTIEYQITLTLDNNSEIPLTATSNWSEPVDLWGDKDTYLTSSKSYTIGTKNFGGLQGTVTFRKLESSINVKFQLSREPNAIPAPENTTIDISEISTEFGYSPRVIVFMFPENSTNVIPALIQNNAIYFPASNLNMISTSAVGEVEGYLSLIKPRSK